MNFEEIVRTLNMFSMGIIEQYQRLGCPPHDSVVVLLLVDPSSKTPEASVWVGPPEDAPAAMLHALPGFEIGIEPLQDLIKNTPPGPAGTLRVFVFNENGSGSAYLATAAKAKA